MKDLGPMTYGYSGGRDVSGRPPTSEDSDPVRPDSTRRGPTVQGWEPLERYESVSGRGL